MMCMISSLPEGDSHALHGPQRHERCRRHTSLVSSLHTFCFWEDISWMCWSFKIFRLGFHNEKEDPFPEAEEANEAPEWTAFCVTWTPPFVASSDLQSTKVFIRLWGNRGGVVKYMAGLVVLP